MKWEYKSVRFTKKSFLFSSVDMGAFDLMLNEHADRGWGVVSVNAIGLGVPTAMTATFKRERASMSMTHARA